MCLVPLYELAGAYCDYLKKNVNIEHDEIWNAAA